MTHCSIRSVEFSTLRGYATCPRLDRSSYRATPKHVAAHEKPLFPCTFEVSRKVARQVEGRG